MPNVPNVPGVPALTSYTVGVITLLTADAISLLLGTPQSLWNVFLDGAPAFDFQSIAGFGYKQDWVIADYPTDDGGFFSYDKVQLPFECHLRITSGGTEEERQALIEEVTAAANTLNLYDIVTPEKVYPSCNVSRINYDRTAERGAGMIVIDVTFQEIRSSQAAAFSNTQQPGSAGQQGVGNVQPTTISGPGNIQSFPLGSVQ
jgi:hypothetical protein